MQPNDFSIVNLAETFSIIYNNLSIIIYPPPYNISKIGVLTTVTVTRDDTYNFTSH